MKNILYFALIVILVCAISCAAKSLTPTNLNGTWYVFQNPNVKFTFEGDSTLFIDDSIEGDEYVFRLSNDTLYYYLKNDKADGEMWLYLDMGTSKSIFAYNENEHFILRKKELP